MSQYCMCHRNLFVLSAVLALLLGEISDAGATKVPTSVTNGAHLPDIPHGRPQAHPEAKVPVEPAQRSLQTNANVDGDSLPKLKNAVRSRVDDIVDESNIQKQLREYEREPSLDFYDGQAQVRFGFAAGSSKRPLDEFLRERAEPGTAIRVYEDALLRPQELKRLTDAGYDLHVRQNITFKSPVRVVGDAKGNLEAIVDYRPRLSLSGDVYANLNELRNVDAKQMVEKMRVVLLADPQDLRQIDEYKKVVGSKLFVPRNEVELSQYVAINRNSFFVVAGHSENGRFKVERTSGESLFEVPFEKLNTEISDAGSAQLTLSCSAACRPTVSGPTREVSHREVVDMLDKFGHDEHLLAMMERVSDKSGVPMLIRREFKDSGRLIMEPDVSRALPRPGVPVHQLVARFSSDVRVGTGAVPTVVEGLLISEKIARSEARWKIVGYVLMAAVTPLFVWTGISLLFLLNLQSPYIILPFIENLVERDFSNDAENAERFLTSNIGLFMVGSYALAWSAGLFFCIFFGMFALALNQIELTLALVVSAVALETFWHDGWRVYFASGDGILALLQRSAWRAAGWAVPAALTIFGFCLVEHWGSGDVKMFFENSSEITHDAMLLTILVGLVNFLVARDEDLGLRTLSVITLPWKLMVLFDLRRMVRKEITSS